MKKESSFATTENREEGILASPEEFFVLNQSLEEKNMIDSIRSWTDEQFWEFLTTKFVWQAKNGEGYVCEPQRHRLSQGVVGGIMDRAFKILEANPEMKDSFGFMMDVDSAIQLYGDFKREKEDDESITDKAYKAFVKICGEYPEAASKFWEVFGQNAQTVRPDIFIEGVADMAWRPEVPEYIKSHAYHDLNYQYAFNGDIYDNAIINNLDFKNPANYFKTGVFLNFIKGLHGVAPDFDFSEEGGMRLQETLRKVVEKEEGSYLLNIRASKIYEEMRNEATSFMPDRDQIPFLIEEKRYAWEFNDQLFLADLEDYDSIKKAIEDFLRTDEEAMALTREQGTVPKSVFKAAEEKYRKIENFFVKPVKIEDLAIARADKTLEGKKRNSQDLFDYQYLVSGPTREIIEREFNFQIENLSLKEQFYFLNFVKNKTSAEVEPVREFVEKYGVTGMRTFLSLDYGKDLGDKIVDLGGFLEPEVAKAIFTKYGEIADSVDEITVYLKANFGQEVVIDNAAVDQIAENLLRRGRDLLAHFSGKITSVKEGKKAIPAEDVLRELDGIKTETFLFLASFKTLREKGIAPDFSEIKNLDFRELKGTNLSEEEIQEMREIFRKNYSEEPMLLEDLLRGFGAAVKKIGVTFYALKYKEKIIAFIRFDKKGGNTLHAASFNVDAGFKGSEIGTAILEKTQDLKAIDYILEAECSAIKNIGAHYVEDSGFVANRFFDYASAPSFSIERNDKRKYPSKLLSQEQIIELANSESGSLIITSSLEKNPSELKLYLVNEGYLLTRYFKNGGNWYCVFEPGEEPAELPMAA